MEGQPPEKGERAHHVERPQRTLESVHEGVLQPKKYEGEDARSERPLTDASYHPEHKQQELEQVREGGVPGEVAGIDEHPEPSEKDLQNNACGKESGDD